jgi:hypothetical protein
MNLYREIKNDISIIILIILIVVLVKNQFDFGLDDSDLDGWNRSGFEVLKDHKTGKEYLYRNGIIINRETGEQLGKN